MDSMRKNPKPAMLLAHAAAKTHTISALVAKN
jgi:hypothetical protein